MKRKILSLTLILALFGLALTPLVHADFVISSLAADNNASNSFSTTPTDTQVGTCFTTNQVATLTTATFYMSRNGAGSFPNMITILVYSTTGSPQGSPLCESGTIALIATSNAISPSTLPIASSGPMQATTFTFASGSIIPGSYMIVVHYVPNSGSSADFLNFAANSAIDTSQDYVDNAGGSFTGTNELNCNATDFCVAYSLSGTAGSPPVPPVQNNWKNGINEASLFVGIAFIIVIVTAIKKQEYGDELLEVALGLGVFFIILQALAAIV